MRVATIFASLAAFASFAAAFPIVTRQGPPECSWRCFGTSDPGNCSLTDNACLCRNQAFVAATTACIRSACNPTDAAQAEAFSRGLCQAAGVEMPVPVVAVVEPSGPVAKVDDPAETTTTTEDDAAEVVQPTTEDATAVVEPTTGDATAVVEPATGDAAAPI